MNDYQRAIGRLLATSNVACLERRPVKGNTMKNSCSLLPLVLHETTTKNDPWTCRNCGEMIKTSDRSITCSCCCGRLHPAPRVEDLPLAWRATRRGPFTRLFLIADHSDFWRYVLHAHKKALDQRSGGGTVVAKVFLKNGSVQARVFRQVQPRKNDV